MGTKVHERAHGLANTFLHLVFGNGGRLSHTICLLYDDAMAMATMLQIDPPVSDEENA